MGGSSHNSVKARAAALGEELRRESSTSRVWPAELVALGYPLTVARGLAEAPDLGGLAHPPRTGPIGGGGVGDPLTDTLNGLVPTGGE